MLELLEHRSRLHPVHDAQTGADTPPHSARGTGYGTRVKRMATTDETAATLQTENARLHQRVAALEQERATLGADAARYRAMTELMADCVYVLRVDRDGQLALEWVTHAFAQVTGYTAAELQNPVTWATLHHPDDQALMQQQMTSVLAGQSAISEYRLRTRTGETRWVRAYVHPEWDATQQRVIRLIGATQDITERKQTEQALTESEARYRTLVETSPGAIVLTELDGTIRFCNGQAAHLFGYATAADLLGKNGADLIVFDPLTPGGLAYAQRIAASGNLRNIEYTLRRSDGSRFPAEVSSAAITNAEGVPVALTIIVHDISERKQAEYALVDAYHHLEELNEHVIRSRNLLQAVFDGLDDGLVLLDGDGTVRAVNRALSDWLGSTPQKLIGQNWSTLYPRIAPDFPHDLALNPGAAGRSRYRHTRYLNLDGETRILDVETIALQNSAEAAQQVIVHITDVTDKVQLQARIIENERFAAGGRLAASVAHEINTPLQSLQTALGLARKMTDAGERDMFLTHAQEEIQRVARIVRQLLDLYRPGSVASGSVDVNALVERLLLLINKRLKDQRVTATHNLTPDLPPVHGRVDELMQVLLNLMVNAIDAMPDGGTLQVQTRMADQNHPALEIAITDSGFGIAPHLHKRIFEPFVTTREGGTGLGLTISAKIVSEHGGKITLASQMGRGSTFTVTLPLRPAAQTEASA